MKPIAETEATRRSYHADSQSNTVHRASLLAPNLAAVLPGSSVDLSFSNHFLVKRGHEDVACRITAIGLDGSVISSRTEQVTEPRVYTFELSELAGETADNYMVEFFSSRNLFIPFPAAMVNHRGSSFLNSVHSYNRVLNDVFEDDAINAEHVSEASIDVRVDDEIDTFALFTSGPTACRGTMSLELRTPDLSLEREISLDMPRLTNRWISIADVFGNEFRGGPAVLTIQQPQQPMFYGRMLAGLHSRRDGAIAANHSFYDCSNLKEYCEDGRASARVYPILEGFRASVRVYPIFSPCELRTGIDFYDGQGRLLAEAECEAICSPSANVLDISVEEVLERVNAAGAVAFRFRTWPTSGGMPRRLNHQIVYSDPHDRSPLEASVAISLRNPNHFQPTRKTGLVWGQCAVHENLISRVGLTFDDPEGESAEGMEVWLLSEKGEVYRADVPLHPGAAHAFDPAELVPELVPSGDARPHYLWYWARSERSDLSGYSVTRHALSSHCSGEHCF